MRSSPSPTPCRVAIVGAGYTAGEHARAFRDIPGVTLAGVFSRTRSAAETFAAEHGIELVCDSVAELFDRTRADLVVVTVVELAMNPVCQAAFEFPWAVLMEKPPGYNLADAGSIREGVRRHNRRVFVALNRRFMSATTRTLADLAGLDVPRFVKVQDQQSMVQAREAGEPDAVVDNFMFANAVHTIDYLRVFGRGAVQRVTPVIPWNESVPGVVVARVDFDSGDTGLYEGIWHAPGPWAVSVTVPGRRWEMRPLEELQTQVLGARPERITAEPRDSAFKPGFRTQAAHAVAAALGQPSDSVTFDDAFLTMQLIADLFGRR